MRTRPGPGKPLTAVVAWRLENYTLAHGRARTPAVPPILNTPPPVPVGYSLARHECQHLPAALRRQGQDCLESRQARRGAIGTLIRTRRVLLFDVSGTPATWIEAISRLHGEHDGNWDRAGWARRATVWAVIDTGLDYGAGRVVGRCGSPPVGGHDARSSPRSAAAHQGHVLPRRSADGRRDRARHAPRRRSPARPGGCAG